MNLLKIIGVIVLLPVLALISFTAYGYFITFYPYYAYGAVPVDRIVRKALWEGESDPCQKIITPVFMLTNTPQDLISSCYSDMAHLKAETSPSIKFNRGDPNGTLEYATFDPEGLGTKAKGLAVFVDEKTGTEIGGVEVPLIVYGGTIHFSDVRKNGARVTMPGGRYLLRLYSLSGELRAESDIAFPLSGNVR